MIKGDTRGLNPIDPILIGVIRSLDYSSYGVAFHLCPSNTLSSFDTKDQPSL